MIPRPISLTTIYKETNSSKISTDIYVPQNNASSKSHPVLINIHGGAFMLGHAGMVSLPQITDCLDRNWIVMVPNHRLCPGVDVLSGPVQDMRDLLAWIYGGFLEDFLREIEEAQGLGGKYRVDLNKVMAFGTSSGGFLALSLVSFSFFSSFLWVFSTWEGYDVPRPPAAILDFYGPAHFTDPFWSTPLPHVQASLPSSGFEKAFLEKVYDEFPIPTTHGISLEGQSQSQGQGSNKPDFSRPRDAFALTQIANGTVLQAIYPVGEVGDIDPVVNIATKARGRGFPPTFIVHGDADWMVPVELSRKLFEVLKGAGVECGMVEVPGEGHTFAMGMEVGGATWVVQRRGFEWLEGIISRLT
ncbi:Alpha/Beta hydrolase protein [Aspergillus cavernicola]|uniref:Alpha/Beta hydrolase protein n=1 Tax=Aspergillus cavernicola TaxID=176166 RepID=A0ABR4IBV2_9EURO